MCALDKDCVSLQFQDDFLSTLEVCDSVICMGLGKGFRSGKHICLAYMCDLISRSDVWLNDAWINLLGLNTRFDLKCRCFFVALLHV